jgi:hypothetical protein
MAAPAKPAEAPPRDAPARDAPARDDRLAAALRENLKRRKEQARAQKDKSKSSPEDKTGG